MNNSQTDNENVTFKLNGRTIIMTPMQARSYTDAIRNGNPVPLQDTEGNWNMVESTGNVGVILNLAVDRVRLQDAVHLTNEALRAKKSRRVTGGAYADGPGAVAVDTRGVHIANGDVSGNIITGDGNNVEVQHNSQTNTSHRSKTRITQR